MYVSFQIRNKAVSPKKRVLCCSISAEHNSIISKDLLKRK